MKNNSAKLFCVIIILGLLLTLAACNREDTYVLRYMEVDGTRHALSDLDTRDTKAEDSFIKLNTDGTGEVCLFGEKIVIEWDGEKMWPVTNDDDIAAFNIDGNFLTLELNSEKLIFVKE